MKNPPQSDMSYDSSNIKPLTLVQMVCLKPKRWLPNGNLLELTVFLDGMVYGIRSTDGRSSSKPNPLDAIKWLENHFEQDPLRSDRIALVKELINKFGSEAEVLAQLNEHLDQIQQKHQQ